jgi:sec-independent protein translocase protein TatC
MTLVPFSVVLFFSGAALGFYLTPLFFRFFLQFQPPNSESYWSYASVASLLAKMLLVFGICFQVPVVTVFLNKIGLMSRNWMIEYWRHVVVVMFAIVAIITPTWDPVTLTAAALPPCLLYGVSIWLVKWL